MKIALFNEIGNNFNLFPERCRCLKHLWKPCLAGGNQVETVS